jgi:hypothetical protein
MIVTEPAPLMRWGGVDGNGLYGRQTLRGNLAYGGGPHEWIDTDPAGPAARRPRRWRATWRGAWPNCCPARRTQRDPLVVGHH